MPVYEYDCQECGTFTAMRPMSEFREACACPTCGSAALRASLSAPALAGIASPRSSLVASNESGAKVAHPGGCGCCVRRWPLPGALASKGGRIFSSGGPPARNGQ